jgi:hypothetical protein
VIIEVTAVLKNCEWRGRRIAGFVYNDTKGRFANGEDIVTSSVLEGPDRHGLIHTKNSTYRVEGPIAGTPPTKEKEAVVVRQWDLDDGETYTVQPGENGDFLLSVEDARRVCRPGTQDCCIFVVAGPDGFGCAKFTPLAALLIDRNRRGQMRATREGQCKEGK